MTILEAMKEKRLFFDGAMGTLLQAAGLPEGRLPDLWSVERPEVVQQIHLDYLNAGSRILKTNTFGAHAHKLAPYGYTVAEVMEQAVQNARVAFARAGVEGYVAADLGPTGKLLKPYGDLEFESAVSLFAEMAQAAETAGADCILIETMSDLYETKAAVLAAKEQSKLPIFVTLIFDEQGKLLTGGTPAAVVALLEGLGVCAFGINCGMGPTQMAPILEAFWKETSTPLILNPNAGLPRVQDGSTVFDITPDEFAAAMRPLAPHALLMGGCCGTTPAHIAALVNACGDCPPESPSYKDRVLISSYCQTVVWDGSPIMIGERINPSGKKKLQQALREGNTDYVLREALAQEEAGAQVLDVNVGVPGLEEAKVLCETVQALQSVTTLPLQLDSADPIALEAALRLYNGTPLVNSVNGKEESLAAILPLVKKYGGGLICLTLDESGIPETAEGRLAIARRIAAAAEKMGIPRRALFVDGLTLPVSAGGENAEVTLETLRRVKRELGLKTALGVSNVSFGLPNREQINSTFFTMALCAGLDAAIVNPCNAAMRNVYQAYLALSGQDAQCRAYIAAQAAVPTSTAVAVSATTAEGESLCAAVRKGLRVQAEQRARQEAERGRDSLELINQELVPALDEVGKGFESGRLFLPQLLMSAEAAKAAFEVLQGFLAVEESEGEPQILLATVKGDIHDIGKNIVKVLLESHRFRVLDLGKDVPPEKIVETVRKRNIPLVGLSALMTTTAPYMAETIRQLRASALPCQILVGGAVITQEYAAQIGADVYAADAMDTVHYAQRLFGRT